MQYKKLLISHHFITIKKIFFDQVTIKKDIKSFYCRLLRVVFHYSTPFRS